MPLKELIMYSSPEEGTCYTMQGHSRSRRFDQEVERACGTDGPEPLLCFQREMRAGHETWLRTG